jgi:O-antigen/teichoic acid export membrane protein
VVEPTDGLSVAPAGTGAVRANAVVTLLFRAGTLLVGFVTLLLTSRLMQADGRGAYVLATLSVTLAVTALGNFGVAVTNGLATKERPAREVISDGLTLAIGSGILGAGLLLVIGLLVAPRGFGATVAFPLALPAILVAQTLIASAVARGRVRMWNVLQLLPGAATAVGIAVLVGVFHMGFIGAAFAFVGAQLAAAIVTLAVTASTWRGGRIGRLRRAHAVPMVKLSLKIGAINLVGLFNYRVELFILEAVDGLASVGQYSLSVALAELLWVIPSALSPALIAPIVAADTASAAQLVARGIRHVLALTSLLGVLLALVAVPAIPFVFGQAFRPSITPVLILIPGAVAFAPGAIVAVYFSMRTAQTRYPLRAALISAAITTVIAVVAIPWAGSAGAALATTCGYCIGMGANLWWFVRATAVTWRDILPGLAEIRIYREMARRAIRAGI